GTDPEVALDLLGNAVEAMVRTIADRGGTVVDIMGDGIMAVFGAPLAQEDHAHRACHAALELHGAVAQRLARVAPAPPHLDVRVGVNSGAVIFSTHDDRGQPRHRVVGMTVHLASRMESSATPGSVYVTESTYTLVTDVFECEPLGMLVIKGVGHRVGAYRLIGSRLHAASPTVLRAVIRSPLIGRTQELRRLTERIGALGYPAGRIIFIYGDAGIGKSRLLEEVRAAVSGRCRWLEARSASVAQRLSYWPVLELFRADAGIAETDTAATALAKLGARVTVVCGDEADEVLPHAATLLGLELREAPGERVRSLDADSRAAHLFRACRRYFQRLANRQPTVLIMDDIYWIDDASATLLEHLYPLVTTAPLLICCLNRPESGPTALRLHEAAFARHG
ncbi:MAG: AAA family ATPase, partial [bacterium]